MIWFLAAIVMYAFGAQSDNTKSQLAYLLIKKSLLVIYTDIQCLFKEYLRPPGEYASLFSKQMITLNCDKIKPAAKKKDFSVPLLINFPFHTLFLE